MHGEEKPQKVTGGNLRRIVGDPNRFGVSGRARADGFILGCARGTSGISRCRLCYALNAFENGLNAPETASCKDSTQRSARRREGIVNRWSRKRDIRVS